jgi:hypothetical protein
VKGQRSAACGGVAGAVSLLAVPYFYWLQAASRTPAIRAIPALRYSPRFGVAVIVGILLLALMAWPMGEQYTSKNETNEIIGSFTCFAAVLLVMTSRWFSLGRSVIALLIALTLGFALLMMAPSSAAAPQLEPRLWQILAPALVIPPVCIIALPIALSLIRGARRRSASTAVVFAIYTVSLPLAIALAIWFAPPAAYRLAIFFAAWALLVELICWVSGRLDLLPAQR